MFDKCSTFASAKKGFRSSVGLEQRPSKAWVQGSNPCGITLRILVEYPFFVLQSAGFSRGYVVSGLQFLFFRSLQTTYNIFIVQVLASLLHFNLVVAKSQRQFYSKLSADIYGMSKTGIIPLRGVLCLYPMPFKWTDCP